MEFDNLVNINSVCQKWHQLATPMVYKSLKVLRLGYVENKYYDDSISDEDKLAAEVKECIDNNIKHKYLVQESKLYTPLPPFLAQEFFGTFCHLSKLTIYNIRTSQDFILTCLKPLKNLKQLDFDRMIIEEAKSKQFVFEPVQLPPSLKKMKISSIGFIKDHDLIKQTLCSHTNLEEFIIKGTEDPILLTPFNTHYPTLKKFTYVDHLETSSITRTYKVIKSNPQLTELYFESHELNSHIVTLINSYLPNLIELELRGSKSRDVDTSHIRFKLPMKISKLTLYWSDLTPGSVDSFLSNLPHLKDLHISIDQSYTPWTWIIKRRCTNLVQLTYNVSHLMTTQTEETNSFDQFLENEFSQNEYQCSQTLQSLNLSHLDLSTMKPEYLDQFPNLIIINFVQHGCYCNLDQWKTVQSHLSGFTGWKLKLLKNESSYRGFLYKPNSELNPLNLDYFKHWY